MDFEKGITKTPLEIKGESAGKTGNITYFKPDSEILPNWNFHLMF